MDHGQPMQVGHFPQHPEVQSTFDTVPPVESAGFYSPSHTPAAGPNEPPRAASTSAPRSNSAYYDQLESVDPLACLTGIAGCSMIVVIQAAVECGADYNDKGCKDEYGYTVAAGVISFVVAIIALLCNACCSEFFPKIRPAFAIFLVIWWIGGTGVSTFKAPFSDTGNGFFASWACFITAFLLAGSSSNRLRTFLGNSCARVAAGSIEAKLSSTIFAASVVLFFAVLVKATEREHLSSREVADDIKGAYEKTTNQEAWGIACSLISALFIPVHKTMRL